MENESNFKMSHECWMKCWMKVETDLNFTQYITQWFARITLLFDSGRILVTLYYKNCVTYFKSRHGITAEIYVELNYGWSSSKLKRSLDDLKGSRRWKSICPNTVAIVTRKLKKFCWRCIKIEIEIEIQILLETDSLNSNLACLHEELSENRGRQILVLVSWEMWRHWLMKFSGNYTETLYRTGKRNPWPWKMWRIGNFKGCFGKR